MMSRRKFLATFGLSAGIVACGDSDKGSFAENPDGIPNVLFISVDDLNGWTGFLRGHPQVLTPNMDRLAKRSAIFERAYCNAPLCGPSRASALTGCYPHTTGVFDNSNGANPPGHLTTLPKLFSDNGYTVSLHGKVFHIGDAIDEALPSAPPVNNKTCSNYPEFPVRGLFDWGELDVDDARTFDGQVSELGMRFLARAHHQPFFLALGFFRPHLAWYNPRKYFELYPENSIYIPEVPPDILEDIPSTGKAIARFPGSHPCITDQGLWRAAVRAYLASVSFVDAQIGKICDFLESSPYRDNTVVVLWSDNGFHLGEKFHWHKMALWEESTRVPLLISTPDQKAANEYIKQPVGLIDMFPTLVDLCGLRGADKRLQGHSLVPLLKDTQRAWDHPVLSTYMRNHHAIRYQQWRYIRYENGEEELYDRDRDPGETENLAVFAQYSDVKSELGRYIPGPV